MATQGERITALETTISIEIPDIKKSVQCLDKKFDIMNNSLILIKDKVLNGSQKSVSPFKFWSLFGGIILTFGTIIIWILGQLK